MGELVIGIDVGTSEEGPTSAMSFFIASHGHIDVAETTRVLTGPDLQELIRNDDAIGNAQLVTLDAQLTPNMIPARPPTGIAIDKRFARGAFQNGHGHRGLQPGSLATPIPGWQLYGAGMHLRGLLETRGLSYLEFPVAIRPKAIVEVIPKLTQGLISPQSLVVGRPMNGGFKQLDNWLFPHLWVTAPVPEEHEGNPDYPRHGAQAKGAADLLGVQLGQRVLPEANRIMGLRPVKARHEAIGAFAAGLQGALALTVGASLVGAPGPHEGYFLLPRSWHDDWETAWETTMRPNDTVSRILLDAPTA